MLRTEFYTYGTAGTASIVIERLNKISLVYETAYVGKADLGTFKDTDNYVEVNMMDSGLATCFKDNAGTEYAILDPNPFLSPLLWAFYLYWNYPPGVGVKKFKYFEMIDLARTLIDQMTGGKITDGTYLFKSDILTQYASFRYFLPAYPPVTRSIVMTTGESIRRGAGDPQLKVKTSFDDLFKAINQILGVGVGIEIDTTTGREQIRIELKSYFFDNISSVIDLGSSKTINISIDKNSFNKLKVGWPEKEYTNNLAQKESNYESSWVVNNAGSTNELDLTSKYRTDTQGITELLIYGNDTSDDDIFICDALYDNYETLFYTNTPIKDDYSAWTTGNAWFSPRSCIYSNLSYISSLLYNFAGENITFTSGSINLSGIQIDFGGGWVAESDPVVITAPAYFIPVTFEIECALPNTLIASLNSNSNRRASFEYEGVTYYGWIMEVKAKLAGRGSGKIKLLSLPDNDLTPLIR